MLPLLAYLLMPAESSDIKRNGALLAAAVVGMMAPEFFIKRRRSQYLSAVENGLSDASDLMVICVESGLGLEPAIERVGHEITIAHPQVAAKFELTTNELRIIADRRTVLLNLGLRTGLEPLKRLSSILVQTLQYGTPLGTALRVLSAELRAETMTWFEAEAARLPVMLTVPMILFHPALPFPSCRRPGPCSSPRDHAPMIRQDLTRSPVRQVPMLLPIVLLAACGGPRQPSALNDRPTLRVVQAAMSSGSPEIAVSVVRSILTRERYNIPAQFMLGDALCALKLYPEGAAAYNVVLKLRPEDAAAHLGLGRIRLAEQDPKAAEAQFRGLPYVSSRNNVLS